MIFVVCFLLSTTLISIESISSRQGFKALDNTKDKKLAFDLLSIALNDSDFDIRDCVGDEVHLDAREIEITDTGRGEVKESAWITKLTGLYRQFLVGDLMADGRQYAFSIKKNYLDSKFQTPSVIAYNCTGQVTYSLSNEFILNILKSKNHVIKFSWNYKFEDCEGNISNKTHDFENDFKLRKVVTFYDDFDIPVSEVGQISPIGFNYVQYAGTSLDGKMNLQFEGYEDGTMLKGREFPCPGK